MLCMSSKNVDFTNPDDRWSPLRIITKQILKNRPFGRFFRKDLILDQTLPNGTCLPWHRIRSRSRK